MAEEETLANTPPLPADPFLDRDARPLSITAQGYGALRFEACDNAESLGQRLLDFCVEHHKALDTTLTQYGILVAQYEPDTEFDIPFYILRPDGWVLGIPGSPTRQHGLIQLVQAFMDLQTQQAVKPLLKNAGISAYRF